MHEASYCNGDWATDIEAASTIYAIFGDSPDIDWPDPDWGNNKFGNYLNTTTTQPNGNRQDYPPICKGKITSYPHNMVPIAYLLGAGLHAGSSPYSHIYPHSTPASRTLSGNKHSFTLKQLFVKSGDNIAWDYLGCVIPSITYSFTESDPSLKQSIEVWSNKAVAGVALTDPATQIVVPTNSTSTRYTHTGSDTMGIGINGSVSAIIRDASLTISKSAHLFRTKRVEARNLYPQYAYVGATKTSIDMSVIPLDSKLKTLLHGRSFSGNDVDITLPFWKESEDTANNDEVTFKLTYCDLRRGRHKVSLEQFNLHSSLSLEAKTTVVTVYDGINGTGTGKYPC